MGSEAHQGAADVADVVGQPVDTIRRWISSLYSLERQGPPRQSTEALLGSFSYEEENEY